MCVYVILWLGGKVIGNVKNHIFNKRQKYANYISIRENLGEKKLLINLDFEENYSKCNQNETEITLFGNNCFSLFTACAFYSNQGAIEKFPITVTTEPINKSRIA